ncbi:hypothetical protein GCM10010869_02920 [Mesorhizobium tianshanense]|uniref:Uncharacterized protein n=1 Tax=Mesorhizobium tianshanense TaxID=39844 RepID=A0A562PCL7_9HYPH|nr:hypothetical protein [Mesorhizobium tianshanense]TWI41970.1 hypothetical protein IQ26_00894 [Mesorhizobium tianshanense]GLS34704.1 hypothetical protein GCM10010869_02920 [Mesorhizobium tianshanense]
MQIAPVGALEVVLANMTTSVASQQQAAVAVAAQPGNRMVGAMQEKQAASKLKAPDRSADALPAGAQVAQSQSNSASVKTAQSLKTEPASPLVEQQLFRYLTELESSGLATGNVDPSALARKGFDSLGAAMEQFQKAFDAAGRSASPASEAAPAADPEEGTARTEAPHRPNDGAAANGDQIVEKMLQNYISVSWAVFGASLASNSVTAATASLNTLIKQQ